jgi:hypothetical protein
LRTFAFQITLDQLVSILTAFWYWLSLFWFWLNTLYGYAIVFVAILTVALLRPHCDTTPGVSFFDDERGKFVQVLDLTPKHLLHPLFHLRLFEFSGIVDYEVSVFDCGVCETILSSNSFKVKKKGDKTKVYLKHKSMLRKRDIPKLKVTMERDMACRDRVHYHVFPDRIELTNDNNFVVKNYALTVRSVPSVDKLRGDSKVYDVYPSDGQMTIRVAEIPAMTMAHQGRQTIWF